MPVNERHLMKTCLCMTAAALLLTGCAIQSQPYPRYWSPIVMNQKECPDLSGHYQIDNADCQAHRCESLYSKFPPSYAPGWSFLRDLREIELQGVREGRLQIHYPSMDGGSGATFSLQRGTDFQCESGQLVFETPGSFMVGDGAIGRHGALRRYFSRTTDGSLVMREAGSAGGVIFLFIPVYLSNETWTRWMPSGK